MRLQPPLTTAPSAEVSAGDPQLSVVVADPNAELMAAVDGLQPSDVVVPVAVIVGAV